jgi:hypothetical protein
MVRTRCKAVSGEALTGIGISVQERNGARRKIGQTFAHKGGFADPVPQACGNNAAIIMAVGGKSSLRGRNCD